MLPLAEAERVLLCSDGVTGMIGDDEIATLLARATPTRATRPSGSSRPPLAAGGIDNATAVVVDVMGLVSDRTYDSERQRGVLAREAGGPAVT